MSAQGTYRFYSVERQTILLVNGEPLGSERVNLACFARAFFIFVQFHSPSRPIHDVKWPVLQLIIFADTILIPG